MSDNELDCQNSSKESFGVLNELSGALGDLGTFLPHVLAAITVAGLNPAGIFACFGLFYLFSGWFYAMPMAVQPMKAASAAVLVQNLTPGEVAASGIIIGVILVILAITGLIKVLSRITPAGVTGGIQIGLGLSLEVLGLKLVISDPFIGIIILLGMAPLLVSRRLPAALFALLAGIGLGFILNPGQAVPQIELGVQLPKLILPHITDFEKAFAMVAIPQLPLTLTNAILVTVSISAELYKERASRVTEKNLSLTMGIANLLAAPLGGYMMCHGSGGVAAHHRFGGRTSLTPYIIGTILLILGLTLGSSSVDILKLIPDGVLGSMLFYSGLDLALSSKINRDRQELFTTFSVAAITLAVNPALAFAAGLLLDLGMKRNIIKI